MSLSWAFEVILVSCVLLSTVYCGSFCGPSRMFACVPTRFCSETRSIPSNPAAYYNRQCFSFETCCDLNKVIFGKRYSGGQFLPGPYDQSVYTSEPVNNTGGKTSTTYNHPPNNTGGKTSTIIGEKSVTPNTGKTATSYNPEQTAPVNRQNHINSGNTIAASPTMTNSHSNNNSGKTATIYNHGVSGGSSAVNNGGKTFPTYNTVRPSTITNYSPNNVGKTAL